MNIIKTIRNVILMGGSNSDKFNNISTELKCSRDTAKRLMFAFLYYAEESYLKDILDGKVKTQWGE